MQRHVVAKVEDLPPGERVIVPLGGKGGIGVFNIDGEYYALKNLCPHRGGPLCQGRLRPHVVSERVYGVRHERGSHVLKCAWHQWEFDIATGVALYDSQMRVKTYRVEAEGDEVVLYLGRARC